MTNRLVLYHGGCWDGFCAAWLWSKHWPDAEYVAVSYGEPHPVIAGKDVVVLDFSYPRGVLEAMAWDASSLLVLDHHKTAAEDLEGLPYCTFDMRKSGGRLAWEYLGLPELFPQGGSRQDPPWLVAYTEDRDLWRHELEDTKAINAALRSYPLEFGLWDQFARRDPRDFTPEGDAILRREQQIVDQHVRHAYPVEFDGHQGLAVNATVLFSEIGGALAKESGTFGATWFAKPDGSRVWSLRSRNGGVDVSEIARKRGGGGHAQASGFTQIAK